ncbi:MAG: PQQ-binding-like beta-propeller repeat protein [Candidatus Zhuqueibacterota bacterium]
MRRFKFIILLLGLSVLFFCENKNPTPPPQNNSYPQVDIPWPSLANSPWPIAQGDVQCTGRVKTPGPTSGTVEWVFTTENMGKTYGSPVIGEDGTIYVSTSHQLYAVNQDGTLKWEFTRGVMNLSNVMVGNEDIIYFSCGNQYLDPDFTGCLYALNANGELLWELKTQGMIYNYSSTIGIDGTIYFTDLYKPYQGVGGFLYAVAPDGHLQWKVWGTGGFRCSDLNSISISPDGSTLYVAGMDSTMNAIDAQSGTILWQKKTGFNLKTAALVDNDGNVYFLGQNGDHSNYILSVTEAGEVRWKCEIEEVKYIDDKAGMHLDKDGNIYFCNGFYLCSIDYFESLRWKVPFPEGLCPSTPIIGDSEGNVFLMLSSEYVFSYDSDGHKRFEINVGGASGINGAIVDGRLYINHYLKVSCIK